MLGVLKDDICLRIFGIIVAVWISVLRTFLPVSEIDSFSLYKLMHVRRLLI